MVKHSDDTAIFIHDTIKGHITEWDLIGDYGGIKLDTEDYSDKIFFKVTAPRYLLEAGIANNKAYVIRNHDKLQFSLKQRYSVNTLRMGDGSFQDVREPVEATITIGWTPRRLRAYCEEIVYYIDLSTEADNKNKRRMLFPTISSDPLGKKDMRAFEQVVATRPTHPPNTLLTWIRDRLSDSTEYRSAGDLYKEATTLFQSVSDKIDRARCYSAFWDENVNGRVPKKEPKITPTLYAYLVDGARVKNLEVSHQNTEGGILDFRIAGSLASGEKLSICIECKNAHSNDLIHGLTKQLPIYMRQRESDFGIFFVLWFKGNYFSEPKRFENLKDLINFLNRTADFEGLDNIRVLPLDLSYPEPPSKKHKDVDELPSWATNDNLYLAFYFNKMPQEWIYLVKVQNETRSVLE